MRHLKVKPFVYIVIIYSVVVLLVSASARGVNFQSFLEVARLVPIVVTVDIGTYWVFRVWLWRWSYFQGWLVPFPNLNGTWDGHIQPDQTDDDGTAVGPIRVILTIRQTFDNVSCVMRSAEMESRSYLGTFWIEKEAQLKKLCYSYESWPHASLRGTSPPHYGTALLNIIDDPVRKFEGEYWTARKTRGDISLTFLTRKRLQELPPSSPSFEPKIDKTGRPKE